MSTANETSLSALSQEVAALAQQVRESVVQAQVGQRGIGSGIIWNVGTPDPDGVSEATIITNAHVVGAGRSKTFTVRVADGRRLEATLYAIDPEHDLAALKTRATGLRAAVIGDSAALRVGEFVMAVGNPFGREGAVTTGVVAAHAPADPDIELEPTVPGDPPSPDQAQNQPHGEGYRGRERGSFSRIDLVQADVRLYPGNSGGPLTDAYGRVIGVNSMIGGGLAFAIPSRTAQRFLAEAEGTSERVYLGVHVLTVPLPATQRSRFALQQETLALVVSVEDESPAQAAGILVGDALIGVDGVAIRVSEQLPRVLNRAGIVSGMPRTLQILRGGERIEVALTPVVRVAA